MFLDNLNENIENIQNSEELRKIWINYTKKFNYAKDIQFEDTIAVLKGISKVLEK